MRCPYCNRGDSRVVDSRDVEDSIRRRRECLNPDCRGRFTTYERIHAVALYIVKKDGRREAYSREKLLGGLRKACEKRPLPAGAVEAAAADLEKTLHALNAPEVPSSAVGELVMERLRELDPVAYVRFASVYRQFTDLDAFRAELESLAEGGRPGGAQLPLLDDPELAHPTIRLQPAAPNARTRTRRPVRPVQAPVPMPEQQPAPSEQAKRRRKAR